VTGRSGRLVLAAATAVALLAGCGGDDAGTDEQLASTPSPSPSASADEAPPCDEVPEVQEPRSTTSTDLSVQPEVAPSDEPPPCELVVRDVVVGTGAEVVPGSEVEVKYVGAFYETGEVFDASWQVSPDNTLPFTAGGGNLIPGFDQGVLGMREGGRREVVIPSDLAYGPGGQGPIPPNSTLVFVIDVVSATAPAPAPTTTP
jgi:FKBP-type peptidyl-prolyl cis-trans isomerase